MNNNILEKLEKFGIELPEVVVPVANYELVSRYEKLIYTSGYTPKKGDVRTCVGKLTDDRIEEGYAGARLATLNALAALNELCGGLDNIKRIIKVTGYIVSAEGFFNQPKVLNGASDLLVKIFGDAGKHARCAVGVNSLCGDASLEITLEVEIKDESLCKM